VTHGMEWEVLERHIERIPFSGCWIWMGALRNDGGYGTVWAGKKSWRTHRLAFTLAHGKIPDGLLVCHKCDVRSCVNPDHLFIGTNVDNFHDAILKGRLSGVSRKPREIVRKIGGVCCRGHAITEETAFTKKNGLIECRICQRARRARKAAEIKAKIVLLNSMLKKAKREKRK
jgi:hypothetical protein